MLGCVVELLGLLLSIAAIVHAARVRRGLALAIGALVAHLFAALGTAVFGTITLVALAAGAAAAHANLH